MILTRRRVPPPEPDLPPYPASVGPRAATNLRNRQAEYSRAAADLRRELQRVEDAMVSAVEADDRRTAALAQVNALAKGRR